MLMVKKLLTNEEGGVVKFVIHLVAWSTMVSDAQ